MRITVYGVLGYLASGVLQEEIPSDFPYPEAEDTLDSPAFAADFVRRVRGRTLPLSCSSTGIFRRVDATIGGSVADHRIS
jgi:hypothetical protein